MGKRLDVTIVNCYGREILRCSAKSIEEINATVTNFRSKHIRTNPARKTGEDMLNEFWQIQALHDGLVMDR